jgi:hypothetical protein
MDRCRDGCTVVLSFETWMSNMKHDPARSRLNPLEPRSEKRIRHSLVLTRVLFA